MSTATVAQQLSEKPYPAYRDSGLPWIEKIPEHWDVLPNFAVFAERTERGFAALEMLSVTIDQGIIRQADLLKNSSKKDSSNEDKSQYKRVAVGDIAYNKMRMWQGAVGVSECEGIVSPAYIVLTPREDINTRYFHYLLRTPDYTAYSRAYSYGICDDQLSLRFEDFKRMYSPVPPRREQDYITRILDCKLAEIDQFIAGKRRLIELLNEQKSVIINHAVAKGMTPTVKMKPSGIEWLGEIPEHWEVRRARFLFREVNERSATGHETHLSMSQKYGLVESSRVVLLTLQSASFAGFKICRENDLVLNRLKAHLGVFARASMTGLVSPDYTVLRPEAGVVTSYYERLFRHPAYIGALTKAAKGIVVGFWRLYTPEFYDLRLPVPPASEQKMIMSETATETADITSAIARAEREIEIVNEYRTALISDVVTGKIDVRGVDNGNFGINSETFVEDTDV